MPIPVTKNKDIILDAQYRILAWDYTDRDRNYDRWNGEEKGGFQYWKDVELWVIRCPSCMAIFGYPTLEKGEQGFWFHQVSC